MATDAWRGPPPAEPAGRAPADAAQLRRSVISNDLTIIGHQLRIISKSLLQVDGAIEGEVHGAEIVIGPLGRVTGTVVAEKVIVEGQVQGTIRGVHVELGSTARVEGEIHHQVLGIDKAAEFEGAVRRVADTRALLSDGPHDDTRSIPLPGIAPSKTAA